MGMATVATKATGALISKCLAVAMDVLKLPTNHVWLDYDDEADVLYVSFERPQGATDSGLTEDGVLMRYRGDQLVGVTILNAGKRTNRRNEEIAKWS